MSGLETPNKHDHFVQAFVHHELGRIATAVKTAKAIRLVRCIKAF
jgi:hypothetical protein